MIGWLRQQLEGLGGRGRVMATEQQGPPDPEASPEDLPTGWMQGPEFFGAAFRKHHEDQLRGYMNAATKQLYQNWQDPVLPYHYDVLAIARQFLDADKDDVAVIMAQTACEIATDDIITVLLRRHNLADGIRAWVNDQIARSTTLKHDMLYKLYRALSGDELRQDQKTLWEAYVRRADLRNAIVHTGAHAVKAQAVEACNSALELIHHFEAVNARAVK
ncbi:MAG TPA: hypothetical protein VGT00_08375 [Methylomirabilota bacterium]|jgi:hypothetical protein|nr:hypothetical protein [Methylomirabilota bacterium]